MNLQRAAHVFKIGFILYSGCSIASSEPLGLQLKWRHQFQFAGYYAAIEKGFYAEEGLEVELIEPKVDGSTITPVVTGLAEYGVSSPDIVLHRARGEPVVALASIFQHSPHALVALERPDLQTLHDLAGKRIMMESGSADLMALLLAEQVPLDSIEFTRHTFSESPLIDGSVDALSAYITDEPYALREQGLNPLIFSPRSAGIDFYGDGLFTTEARIREHPEEVAAFLRASLRGWEYAIAHPEEIVDLILEKYSTRKSREALLYEAKRSIDLIQHNLVQVGYMYRGRWEHIEDVYRSVGLIDQPIDLDAMLYSPQVPLIRKVLSPVFMGSGLAIVLLILAYRWRSRTQRRRLSDSDLRRLAEKEALEAENRHIRNESLEKAQLLAHTSHEIRNPLNAIMGYAQIMEEDATDPETKEMARVMLNGAESMLSLLNDLLDCSKIDVGRMELNYQQVDLKDLLTRTAKLFQQVIEKKNLRIEVQVPETSCHTETDPFRVRQILSNLLSNATKFTESGSIILRVDAHHAAEAATIQAYHISVIDSGSGMDAATLKRVFEPFTQANSEIASAHGGTGLGLSLSQKLAKLLGGELQATSELGKGSVFTLVLPVRR